MTEITDFLTIPGTLWSIKMLNILRIRRFPKEELKDLMSDVC